MHADHSHFEKLAQIKLHQMELKSYKKLKINLHAFCQKNEEYLFLAKKSVQLIAAEILSTNFLVQTTFKYEASATAIANWIKQLCNLALGLFH